jgi:sulfite oxidase
MNGEPLIAAHGAPLRVIVPGVAGARSVKWLDTITISEEESQNHYMQRDYKVLPSDAVDAESAERYWGTTPPLMDMPCNSVIASPASKDTIKISGEGLILKGYALPQGDQGPVVKVEVSMDDAKTWCEADIQHENTAGKWAWALWHMTLSKSELRGAGKSGEDGKSRIITFFSKATDQGGNTQEPAQWNLRGVAYNGYGEARSVKVVL